MTRKTLWRAFDGAYVESVLMRYPGRVTMCVSSQAGCGMACPFCATGQAGLTRNLSAAEIVAQVVAGARALARGEVPGGPGPGLQRGVHGHGRAARELRQRHDRGAPAHRPGARRARASRSGRSPSPPSAWCRRSGGSPRERLGVTLAVSLHAPDDELRDELVPGEQALEGGRGARCGLGVRRAHRPPGFHRVRADPGRQRPALAGRGAGAPARRPAGPRQPDPAQPDAGLAVDRLHARRDAGVRGGASGPAAYR